MQVHPGWVIEFHGRKYPITVRGLRIGRGQDNDVVLQMIKPRVTTRQSGLYRGVS